MPPRLPVTAGSRAARLSTIHTDTHACADNFAGSVAPAGTMAAHAQPLTGPLAGTAVVRACSSSRANSSWRL